MVRKGPWARFVPWAVGGALLLLTATSVAPAALAVAPPGTIVFSPSSGAFQGELVQFTAYGFSPPPVPIGGTLIEVYAHLSINGVPFEDVPAEWTAGALNGSFVMPGGPPGAVYNISVSATAEYQVVETSSIEYPLYGTTWATTWGPSCVTPCTPNGFHLLLNLTGPPVGYMGTIAIGAAGANDLTFSNGVSTPYFLYVDSFTAPTTTASGSATYTIESTSAAAYQLSMSTVSVVVPSIPVNQTVGASVAVTGFYTTYNTSTYLGIAGLEGHANDTIALVAPPETPGQVFEFYTSLAILALLVLVVALEVAVLLRRRRTPSPVPKTPPKQAP